MRLHVVTRMPHDRVVLPTGLVVCGQPILAGTDVGVYGPVLHHRPETFGEDVDVFRPERWLGDEEKVRRMNNTLFTFSSGKYNCLGKNIARMEVAKLVPSVIRVFEVS
jgi:cytochrome P450